MKATVLGDAQRSRNTGIGADQNSWLIYNTEIPRREAPF